MFYRESTLLEPQDIELLLPMGTTADYTAEELSKVNIPVRFFDWKTEHYWYPIEFDAQWCQCYGIAVTPKGYDFAVWDMQDLEETPYLYFGGRLTPWSHMIERDADPIGTVGKVLRKLNTKGLYLVESVI